MDNKTGMEPKIVGFCRTLEPGLLMLPRFSGTQTGSSCYFIGMESESKKTQSARQRCAGAGVQELTPAGVVVFNRSRIPIRSGYFRLEQDPDQDQE